MATEDRAVIIAQITAAALAESHCNRIPFAGVLCVVDEPSESSPAGCRGHRVILTEGAAKDALPSLIGMGLCYDGRGHAPSRKVGVITAARLANGLLHVAGYLWADCEDAVSFARHDDASLSYELRHSHIVDAYSSVWEICRCTFTGAAIVPRDQAAYKNSTVKLLEDPDGN